MLPVCFGPLAACFLLRFFDLDFGAGVEVVGVETATSSDGKGDRTASSAVKNDKEVN